MAQIKDDNQEIASLDRKITELEEQCAQFHDQLVQVEADIEERQSESVILVKKKEKK